MISTATLPTAGKAPKYVVFLASVTPGSLTRVDLKPAGAAAGNPAKEYFFVADGYSTGTVQNTAIRVPVPALGVPSRGGVFGIWAHGIGTGTGNKVQVDYKLEYE